MVSDELADIFERRAREKIRAQVGWTPRPKTPSTFKPRVPKRDAPDPEPTGEYAVADCIGAAFGMEYTDAEGNDSRRCITLRRIVQRDEDTIILQAYCHERGAVRHFRADRIEELVHLGTGEVIEDPLDFIESLAAHDPTGNALQRCRPGLQVMTVMSWADGFFDDRERLMMVDYVVDVCEPGKSDLDRITAYVNALHPDEECFYRGLRKLRHLEKDDASRLVRLLNRVARADGVIHESEFYYLVEAQHVIDRM